MSNTNTDTNAEDILRALLEFDPLQAVEDMTGKSYKTHEQVGLAGFGLAMIHNKIKNAALTEAGDTTLSNELVRYREVIEGMGFEEAAAFPFESPGWNKEDPPKKETLFVFIQREHGIVLVFDTYDSVGVNGGNFHYCWKPNSDSALYGVTSSGGFRSLTDQEWKRKEIPPEDLYWEGSHDCREAIKYKVEGLLKHGTFIPKWPKFSQGSRRSGFYLMSYQDWKHPDYKLTMGKNPYMEKIFLERYNALPDWAKEIIGESGYN